MKKNKSIDPWRKCIRSMEKLSIFCKEQEFAHISRSDYHLAIRSKEAHKIFNEAIVIVKFHMPKPAKPVKRWKK